MSKKYTKVTDEELITEMEQMKAQSNGSFLNSADLSRERQKATYEYTGQPFGHLSPQGVSSIVDSSSTEVVDGYTALLSELLFDNDKIAKFRPTTKEPLEVRNTKVAEDLTNYEIFYYNNGWELLNTWVKASLMWKNSIIRWDWVEDYKYEYEEFDEISQEKLDELLADEDVEIIGELEYEESLDLNDPQNPEPQIRYVDVKIKRKEECSGVKIRNVPHENFSIDRNATSFNDFSYIGIVEEGITRSELRMRYPEIFTKKFDEWDKLSNEQEAYNLDDATRKKATAQNDSSIFETESILDANQLVTLTECWMKVDRDGDGIAELKRFVISGEMIIEEEYVEEVSLASLCPIEIPYEFYGLSMADITRPSTLTSTAILRGFVENTYLTNYSPRLADPNVVDFSALQNMKPKQIIPVNGNPMNAVQMLTPENVSPGTVPLLQQMQTIKEQAHGLSKAAQGLNDTLYVSGNSEGKLGQVQTAAQKRIQHIARRYVQTGIERLVAGVYKTLRKKASKSKGYLDRDGFYRVVELQELPKRISFGVQANVGENSNENLAIKYQKVAQILATLNETGRGMVIKEEADARLASMALQAMDMDPMDFIEDYNSEEFRQNAEIAQKRKLELEDRENDIKELIAKYDILAKESNARYLSTQADNAMQDNAKQLVIAMDTHYQKWAELAMKADKEKTPRPEQPDFSQMSAVAYELIKRYGPANNAAINDRLATMAKQLDSVQKGEGMEQLNAGINNEAMKPF